MDKKDALKRVTEMAKKLPNNTAGQRADMDDDDAEPWVIVTNEPCPLCGARLSAHGNVHGIEYLFCTNYPCNYVDAGD